MADTPQLAAPATDPPWPSPGGHRMTAAQPVGDPPSPGEPRLSGRDEAIVEARARGDTLQEIGERFGLSRQRISRILIESGAETANREARAARTARQLTRRQVSAEEVLSTWRSGIGPASVAARLGISRACVSAVIDAHATEADRIARRRAQSEQASRSRRRFSDEALIEAVRASAEWAGRVPSIADYAELARSSDLPSLDTIGLRFGGWNAALRAAGMTPRDTRRRGPPRRWTEAACLEALGRLVEELGELPSITRYEELARERADLPSPATVRNRLGRWKLVALRLAGDARASGPPG